jgi:hypothetical protein
MLRTWTTSRGAADHHLEACLRGRCEARVGVGPVAEGAGAITADIDAPDRNAGRSIEELVVEDIRNVLA